MHTAQIITVLFCLYCAVGCLIGPVSAFNGKRQEEDVAGVEQ